MRYCTKCGKEVRENWKFCLSCGAEVPADAAAEPDGDIPSPPVRRPPEPGTFAQDAPGHAGPARGVEGGFPPGRDHGGGPGSPPRPDARPAVLLSLLVAVALAAGIVLVLVRGGEGSEGESVASGGPKPVEPTPVPVPAPEPPVADPMGALDRARAEAEQQLRQAEEDLRREVRELQAELAKADAEPDGSAATPPRPEASLIRTRIQGLLEPLHVCAAGRRVVVSAKVTFEGATGRVAEATAGGDLPDEVRACVLEALRGMSVPPFADPTFTIDFTLPVGAP